MRLTLKQTKSIVGTALRAAIIVGSAFLFIGTMVGLFVAEHNSDERVICAPDKLYNSFNTGSGTRGVCQKPSGALYLSERIKR